MGRYDLIDFEWSVIEPLLPNKPRGVPRVDDRRTSTASSAFCARARHTINRRLVTARCG